MFPDTHEDVVDQNHELRAEHEDTLAIKVYGRHLMGQVNNSIYLKWIQEVAMQHWLRGASSAAIATCSWIAIRHQITYRRLVFLHSWLSVAVLIDRVRSKSAPYATTTYRGGQMTDEVRSRWYGIEAVSRHQVRGRTVLECFFRRPTKRKPVRNQGKSSPSLSSSV